jgi:hypothetical protein
MSSNMAAMASRENQKFGSLFRMVVVLLKEV